MDPHIPPAWIAGAVLERAALGETAAHVFRLRRDGRPDEFIKAAVGDEAEELRRERDRLAWLAGQPVSVPRLLGVHDDGESVALRMTALAGVPAESLGGVPDQTVVAVAHALATLHAIPRADCPFDQRIAQRLRQAADRVARDLVDEEDFDPERRGRSAASLLDELVRLRPAREDLVFTHGDANLANLIIDGDRVGFVDCHRAGVADRHVDLAIMTRDIERTFGERWVPIFSDAYGLVAPDREKLAYFRLLDEMF